MTSVLPPGLLFILGALLIPFLKGKARSLYLLVLPAAAFFALRGIPEGTYGFMRLMDFELLLRIDRLSLLFGYVFILMTLIGIIYALHVRESGEHVASYIYAGSALGVVLAGDLLTLFLFWEMLTISALFIIWQGRTRASRGAGLRYMLVHLFGGLCLLAGIIMRFFETGATAFDYIGLQGLSSYLIFLGVIINVAIPPLHAWLVDAYPEASVTGTVFLSAFTTKSAVYVLARTFPGAEILVIAGTVMTLVPIFYAVLENDLRKVLSYSLINQVGFMVVGIGLGTSLALNGAVAHAFADILFKGLLLMTVGAVLYRTGTCKVTELGGLYKTMPVTMLFCLIGAASISAFPLLSAFVTKSLILAEVGHQGLNTIWLLLLFASAGVLHHAGIKVPYTMFFAHDCGKRPKEAPLNMQIAMGIAAFFCIFIGVYPNFLYSLLPYAVDYAPYTADHVVTQLLLLLFAVGACVFLIKVHYHPPEVRAVYLDTDWFYRKAGPAIVAALGAPVAACSAWLGRLFLERLPGALIWFGQNPAGALKIAFDAVFAAGGPEGKERLARAREAYPRDPLKQWSVSSTVSLALVFFTVCLLIFYL